MNEEKDKEELKTREEKEKEQLDKGEKVVDTEIQFNKFEVDV